MSFRATTPLPYEGKIVKPMDDVSTWPCCELNQSKNGLKFSSNIASVRARQYVQQVLDTDVTVEDMFSAGIHSDHKRLHLRLHLGLSTGASTSIMNARAVLRYHQETLLKLYNKHFDTTKALQKLLIDEIAPGILDEREADPDTALWLQQWLLDTSE